MSAFANAFLGRRILVTGHTGFKGTWLACWLLRLGADVCGYSIDIPTMPSLFEQSGLERNIRHQIGDIRDSALFARTLDEFRPDYVFHLAAQPIVSLSYSDPVDTVSVNVLGTACVLAALRRVDWPCVAIIVASDKCYENIEQPWGYREIDQLGGKDVYSASKGAAEIVFTSGARSFFVKAQSPVRLASVRAGNVIGGGDWAVDRIVADCIRAWSKGDIVSLRRPDSVRPWQHVLEPLSGYLSLAQQLSSAPELNGESFNFGPPAERARTVLELLTDLAGIFGHPDPDRSYELLERPPFAEAGLLLLNCDKARARLNWEATCNFDETIRLTGTWYKQAAHDPMAILELTETQIVEYENLASVRGRYWARG